MVRTPQDLTPYKAFTLKLSYLALENGFRKHTYERDLLRNHKRLVNYLNEEDQNPNKRLERILALLRDKPWLVIKPTEEIAKMAGITFYPPATKEKVAKHLNYLVSFTDHPPNFRAEDIGDTPEGETLFSKALDSVIIRNINLDLASTAQPLPKFEDLLHYANVIDAVFITETGKRQVYKYIDPVNNPDHEIAALSFQKTGEKYMSLLSRQNASQILNTELRHATLLTKQGGVDIATGIPALDGSVRPPDVVVYNSPKVLKEAVITALEKKPNLKFSYRHIGASENHPFQTMALFIGGQTPLHIATGFGNRDISDLIKIIEDNARIFSDDELAAVGNHMNNFMATWLGLPWDVDWVKSMIKQDDLYRR